MTESSEKVTKMSEKKQYFILALSLSYPIKTSGDTSGALQEASWLAGEALGG